jgi:hypothetical protein
VLKVSLTLIHRRDYVLLKKATTKPELASILGVSAAFLTRVLYKPGVKYHYHQFDIDKKSGGKRTINAPSDELKDLQRRLSELLQNCSEVIRYDTGVKSECLVSHGFERNRSIITNASVHKGKKGVLNLDLDDFFGQFNFGRVRGYFIANKHFKLHPHIATILAQIACYKNSLPQGSPCSPVIANLITNSLDMKLSRLAGKFGCSYSRYADDITFSTRKSFFPQGIVKCTEPLELGGKLLGEIRRSGFSVNAKKTRLQFKDSRQEATGLVVNKKVSVKSEYWRLARAMADRLFKTGAFEISDTNGEVRAGTLDELEGRLAFIDSIDRYNNIIDRKRPKPPWGFVKHEGLNRFKGRHNSRERVYSRFLFYKHFYANNYPTVLTEGKTDNVYLKSALSRLQDVFPKLVSPKTTDEPYYPKLKFPELNKRTMYFLDLGDGATPFRRFVERYESESAYFHGKKAKSPVILVLDNDDGPSELLKYLSSKKVTSCPNTVDEIKKSGFLHITRNLYLILTPLKSGKKNSMMEDLFYKKTLREKVGGKTFSTKSNFDESKHYGKHIFSTKIVRSKKSSINFNKFKYIFKEIERVKTHFAEL